MNGLNISKEEFRKMRKHERDVILFENTENIKSLMQNYIDKLNKHEQDERFHQKAYWLSLAFLTTLFGFKDKILEVIWGT